MKQIYLCLLFLYININVLYATDSTVSCQTCSLITQPLEKLTTILPGYREKLLQNIDTPSPPSFYQNLNQITLSVDHLNKALNHLTLHSALYLTDSNECFLQRLIPFITDIAATFATFSPTLPPESSPESATHSTSSGSLACLNLPSLLLKLSPSIDFRIKLTKKCNKIYDKNSLKDNKTLLIIQLLNDYLSLYQTNATLYQHASNIFQEIIDKNMSKLSTNKQLYNICANCDLSHIHHSCITLYQQYDHIVKILNDTIQYSHHILSPVLIERMVQVPLKTTTGKRIALIPNSSHQTIFIVEDDKIYFPTFTTSWNPKTGLEEQQPSLMLVETESIWLPNNKIESRIVSPEQFQGELAPQCIYISRNELHRRIQENLDNSRKTMETIQTELSHSFIGKYSQELSIFSVCAPHKTEPQHISSEPTPNEPAPPSPQYMDSEEFHPAIPNNPPELNETMNGRDPEPSTS